VALGIGDFDHLISEFIAAGPLANFLLAIALFAGLFMAIGQPVGGTGVGAVGENTPAARAGLRAGVVTGIVGANALRAKCVSSVVVCSGITLAGDQGFATDLSDSVAFQYDNGSGTSFFYFPNYAFQVPGTYYDTTGPSNSITVTAAVPEPASWAMLIAGFGLVGAAMRRRAAALGIA